ncbi:MAG: hypothetical protein GKC10_02160 [Methanosarcinales archaeon]|nr:hypothetical protein [Methanosarcinales archaeon]
MDRRKPKGQVLTATEVAEYTFCPLAWYTGRCGPARRGLLSRLRLLFAPRSRRREAGLARHAQVGRMIGQVHREERRSRWLASLGLLSLALAAGVLWWFR